MALLAERERALLIDDKLVPGGAGTFPMLNPATEEVLGTAADADDMSRAIEAAQRAFDDTDWSRNTALRVRCIRQLRDALRQHVEGLRQLTIAEVGAPVMLTTGTQLEGLRVEPGSVATNSPVTAGRWGWRDSRSISRRN
jgi:aldehyde dehydrogenase (NAD+)